MARKLFLDVSLPNPKDLSAQMRCFHHYRNASFSVFLPSKTPRRWIKLTKALFPPLRVQAPKDCVQEDILLHFHTAVQLSTCISRPHAHMPSFSAVLLETEDRAHGEYERYYAKSENLINTDLP